MHLSGIACLFVSFILRSCTISSFQAHFRRLKILFCENEKKQTKEISSTEPWHRFVVAQRVSPLLHDAPLFFRVNVTTRSQIYKSMSYFRGICPSHFLSCYFLAKNCDSHFDVFYKSWLQSLDLIQIDIDSYTGSIAT